MEVGYDESLLIVMDLDSCSEMTILASFLTILYLESNFVVAGQSQELA